MPINQPLVQHVLRLHKNIIDAIVSSLDLIFIDKEYADKVVANTLKQDKRWGSRDRRFIASSIYDLVRWYRLYEVLAIEVKGDKHRVMLGVYLTLQEIDLPEWFGIDLNSIEDILAQKEEVEKVRAVKESIPDWLDALVVAELGTEVWSKELSALNEQTLPVLRVNSLKGSRDKLIAKFTKQGIEVEEHEDLPEALILKKRVALNQTKEYKDGFVEVQDASSQFIAPFMDLKSGMDVVDACAGAGGKSLHIAALMQNNGKITSMDVHRWKLKELLKRAKRSGVKIIQTEEVNESVLESYKNSVDRLLLDVPCSGLGVLRRNPDDKWKLSQEGINELLKLQFSILSKYSNMLKKGGKLVYATCSILPSENEQQVARFLSESKNAFVLEEERKIMPSEGFDGFYMARLKRVI